MFYINYKVGADKGGKVTIRHRGEEEKVTIDSAQKELLKDLDDISFMEPIRMQKEDLGRVQYEWAYPLAGGVGRVIPGRDGDKELSLELRIMNRIHIPQEFKEILEKYGFSEEYEGEKAQAPQRYSSSEAFSY